MPPLFPLTLSLYAVSCTLSFVPLVGAGADAGRGAGRAPARPAGPQAPLGLPGAEGPAGTLQKAARWTLVLAFLSQALDIAWLCLHGRHPVVDAHEATYFATWLISGLFLLLPLRYAPSVVGALAVPLVPLVMVLQVLARLSPAALRGDGPGPASGAGLSLLAAAHILCATLGSAIFVVAAGASLLYLLTERRLKRHLPQLRLPLPALAPLPADDVDGPDHPGDSGGGHAPPPPPARPRARLLPPRRGVSLEGLDALNRLCVTLGFPVFTAALITGTVWIGHLSAMATRPYPRGSAYLQPQYVLAVLAWLVYGLLLLARLTGGVRGRRAALATLAGFLTTMGVLLLYLFRGSPL